MNLAPNSNEMRMSLRGVIVEVNERMAPSSVNGGVLGKSSVAGSWTLKRAVALVIAEGIDSRYERWSLGTGPTYDWLPQ